MGLVLYAVGLGAVGALAFKAGQEHERAQRTSVSGELVNGPMLTLPVNGVLRVVTPNDREWPQALAYHLALAVRARSMGIA